MTDHQREFFEAISPSLIAIAQGRVPPIRRFFVEWTKGSAKTVCAGTVILWLLAFVARALTIRCGAVDQQQSSEARRVIKDHLRNNPWLAELVQCQNWMVRNDRTDSECLILSSDSASSHGSRPDLTVIDELAHIPESKESFVETLLDDAAKLPDSLVILTTNAGFLETLGWRLRDLAVESDHWHYSSYNRPAPWIRGRDLEDRKRISSAARFRRLWWGEWCASTGDALDDRDISAVFSGELEVMDGSEQDYVFAAGLDLSITRDFSGLVIVGKHISGTYRVARCWLWKPPAKGLKVDLQQIESTVREADRIYRLQGIGADPYQAELLISRLSREGIRIHSRPQTGRNLTEQASMLLEQINSRNLHSYRFEPLETDLRKLTVEEKSYGFRLCSPRDASGHGDLVSSLSIGLAVAKDLSVVIHNPDHRPEFFPFFPSALLSSRRF